MLKKQHFVRGGLLVALLLASLLPPVASALPRQPGEGGPGDPGDPGPDPGPQTTCLDRVNGHLAADGAYVGLDGRVTLSWQVNAPTGCSPRVTLNGAEVTRGGTMVSQPLRGNTTFTLGASIPGHSATLDSVFVTVLQGTVDIKGNGPEWRNLLVGALGIDGLTVRLAENVDMDLSGLNEIFIRKGVRLIAGQPCAKNAPPVFGSQLAFGADDLRPLCGMRGPEHPGPRLYTTTRPNPLFHIRCGGGFEGDGVQLSGFRIQGPHWDSAEGDDNLEQGIKINGCKGVDISNMELSGWSGQAVYVIEAAPPLPPMQQTPDAVRIRDSFIHHNQHIGENGYGVAVADGAQATIERNVFDFNRHAIKASPAEGPVYVAKHNLVLKGGGVHGSFFNAYTHQFDVHGDANCPDIPGNQHTLNCGNAGHEFFFTGNAFQFTKDLAIKVRGTPRAGSHLERNVFAHNSVDDAIDIGGGSALIANTAAFDSWGRYHVCDFTGDGKDDLFLATGATWWMSSSAKHHWSLLNIMPERADQVLVGDFNGDKRCDVFSVSGADWRVSNGGTSPWERILSPNIPLDQLSVGDFNADGRKDFFHRAADGQWSIVSPGVFPMTPVQSSSLPLNTLRFGDFNGDRTTDVLATIGGRWSVSWGARSEWDPINTLSGDQVFVGNVDGGGSDDVISLDDGTWRISREGRGPWQRLADSAPAAPYIGRFTGAPASDLVIMDVFARAPGKILNRASSTFVPYSRYEY
jgi:hypothetical protein